MVPAKMAKRRQACGATEAGAGRSRIAVETPAMAIQPSAFERGGLVPVVESAGGAPVDVDRLRTWIGRSESYRDEVTPTPIAALAATLDRDDPRPRPGDPVPPLWHWLYFLPIQRASELGPDGHAKRGGFLPPVPLPHRMFAGGRYRFEHPLRVGDEIVRESRIVDVTAKSGRSGPLVFVVVRHEISNRDGLALIEEHNIVYREAAAGRAGQAGQERREGREGQGGHGGRAGAPVSVGEAVPPEPTWRRRVEVDDVLLFRYSALTFNGHRIHYDRRYATEVEGYPGLVIHGPLVATLLLEQLREHLPESRVTDFWFRAVRPLFDTGPFFVCGRPIEPQGRIHVWATTADGTVAMDGGAGVAS